MFYVIKSNGTIGCGICIKFLFIHLCFRHKCTFSFSKFWKMVDKQCDGLCTKYRLKMGDECEKMGVQKYVVAVYILLLVL